MFPTDIMFSSKVSYNILYFCFYFQFYKNTVQCDDRLDWMTTDTPPSYVPEQFYRSLLCSAPEAYCGAILHTCTTAGTVEQPDCDRVEDFNCDDINAATTSSSTAALVMFSLVMAIYVHFTH